MNKKLATFISGINCIKGLEKEKQKATLPQEAIVIDLGLDLAANESRNPAKQKQAQPADLQRSASQPTRKDCPAGPARTDKQPVYNQNLPG
jgi:hypothetical protein